jgi:uncharacterized protein YjbI with pentapeptide repeats
MPKHQTFVDYFTHEFMEELWYLQKVTRGDIPKRAEVDPWENFFNVTQGLLSLAPIPGLPLGFLLSKELVKQCIKYGGIALKAAQQANAAAQANYKKGKEFLAQVDSTQQKYEAIAGKPESKGMLQQEGPMDLTAIRVLVELVGRGLVERYEHVLSDYLGDTPDKSQLPLARIMARRLFQYLQGQPLLDEALDSNLVAQRTRLLNGVLLGKIDKDKSWREQLTSKGSGILPRVIKDMHKIELPLQAAPKKQLGKLEKFTAEGVIKRSAWYDDKQIYARPKTEWWGEKGKAAQPKYGYAYIADSHMLPKDSKELSASSSYSTPPHANRYYQSVSVADIQAYLATPEIKAARATKQTASLSFHGFLQKRHAKQELQAVCHEDLTVIKDWSFANFSGVDFSGVQITGNISGADFSGSYLVGITAKNIACQQDHPVNLSRAQLGFADLRDAKLPKADFTQAELQLTNLSGADLTDIQSTGANWYKTDLTGVTRQDLLAEQAKQVTEAQQQFAARMQALDNRLMQTELELVALQARVEELEKQQSAGDNNAEILQKIAALQTQMAEKVNAEFQKNCEAELRELRKDITDLRTDVDHLKVQIQNVEQLEKQLKQLELRFAGQITLTLTGAGDVGRKILVEQTTVQLTHHVKDLEFYLPPTVIERLPEKLTLDELMVQLNALPTTSRSSSVTTSSSSSSTTTTPETKAERKEHKGEAVGGADSSSTIALPKRFDAITVIDQFLTQEENLLVLLGEPGAGKTLSTWQATRRLMAQFRPDMTGQQISQCWLPIHIELNQFSLSELSGILDRQLKTYGLNDAAISKLKQATPGQTLEPKVLLILDGYDELRQHLGENRRDHTDLFKRIGGEGWKKGQLKVLVTCRRRYLQSDDEERMMFGVGQYQRYQRFELLPFTLEQTKDYITARSVHDVGGGLLKAERYFSAIDASDSLKKLVSSPFVLQLFLESLPRLAQSGQDTRHITRFDLYREFFDQWIEREVRRLTAAKKEILGRDSDVALVKDFKRLARYLALSMYVNNTITVLFIKPQQPNVEYNLWLAVLKQVAEEANQEHQALEAQSGESEDDIFGLGSAKPKPDKATLMRQAQARANQLADILPLTRSGNAYKFVHKSFYEYLVAASIIELANHDPAFEAAALSFFKRRLIQTEPAVVAYITELARPTQAQPHPAYNRLRPKLFEIIQRSAKEPQLGQASSNAVTLLNACEENLIGQSWANVQLLGADLSYCVLAHSDLSNANLQGATLIHTVLYQTNLQSANLRHVSWGEFPHLSLAESATDVAWHPSKPIMTVAQGNTILQFNSETGEPIGAPLTGHTGTVYSVAYRPDGRRLASSSNDGTVRQWDAETGQPIGAPLTGHTDSVECVAYHPDGRRLVSGSRDKSMRQWGAETGQPIGAPLTGHTGPVCSVAYRPDGRRLASGGGPFGNSKDYTVRQWDAETGAQIGTPLTGHTGPVYSVAYRPDGRCIVSVSSDKTMRLWDAESHQCLAILQWHQGVNSIVFCAELISTPAIVESKAIVLGSAAIAQTAEYHLAIGDAAGTISYWAISVAHPEAGFRLVAMPKHSGMPLLVNGANLKDCQMNLMSKYLLQQHGADGVVVEEATLNRGSKSEAKRDSLSIMEHSANSVSSSVTSAFVKAFKEDNHTPITNKDIQDFFRSLLSQTTAAKPGGSTSEKTSKSSSRKKSQSVKGGAKKPIESSTPAMPLPKATSSIEVSSNSVDVSSVMVASSESDPHMLQSSGTAMATTSTTSSIDSSLPKQEDVSQVAVTKGSHETLGISESKHTPTPSVVAASTSSSSSSTESSSNGGSVPTNNKDIQNFFRSLLSQTTAAKPGDSTPEQTSKSPSRKKSQSVKGDAKKPIKSSAPAMPLPKSTSSVEVSSNSAVVSSVTVASSDSGSPLLQGGETAATRSTTSVDSSSQFEQNISPSARGLQADVEAAATVVVVPVPQPTLPTSPGGPGFFANNATLTSSAAKPDTKAQSLLTELYALVEEVYPAHNDAVAQQRSDYLAKLQPYQDRRATLTVADRSKLRTLQGELEEAQEAVAGASLG